MSKGTPSQGKRQRTKSHSLCRRCGRRSFHTQKSLCASCGFPHARLRNPATPKARRRHTTGTGRMAHLRAVSQRFKNGFRTGVTPSQKRRPTAAATA